MEEKKPSVPIEKMNTECEDLPICRTCGECCKRYSYFTDWEEEIDRLSFLDTDEITISQLRNGYWKVTFEIPCKHLVQRDGQYYCDIYTTRPQRCREYPQSIIRSGDPDLIRHTRMTCRLIP
jgi:Fe-S-cluster containining protein